MSGKSGNYDQTIEAVSEIFKPRTWLSMKDIDIRKRIRDVVEPEILGRRYHLVVFRATSDEWVQRALDELARIRLKYKQRKSFTCICDCYDSTVTRTGWEVWTNDGMIKMVHYPKGENWFEDEVVLFTSNRCPICGQLIYPEKHNVKGTNGMMEI